MESLRRGVVDGGVEGVPGVGEAARDHQRAVDGAEALGVGGSGHVDAPHPEAGAAGREEQVGHAHVGRHLREPQYPRRRGQRRQGSGRRASHREWRAGETADDHLAVIGAAVGQHLRDRCRRAPCASERGQGNPPANPHQHRDQRQRAPPDPHVRPQPIPDHTHPSRSLTGTQLIDAHRRGAAKGDSLTRG